MRKFLDLRTVLPIHLLHSAAQNIIQFGLGLQHNINSEISIVKNISCLDKAAKIKHVKYFLRRIIGTLNF